MTPHDKRDFLGGQHSICAWAGVLFGGGMTIQAYSAPGTKKGAAATNWLF